MALLPAHNSLEFVPVSHQLGIMALVLLQNSLALWHQSCSTTAWHYGTSFSSKQPGIMALVSLQNSLALWH
jgi:hypothetical protein